MSTGRWKGLRLGTKDNLPVLEKIARQKDAAYIMLQQGRIQDMIRKLKVVIRLQSNYEKFTGCETPSLLDFESINRPEQSIIKRNNFKDY